MPDFVTLFIKYFWFIGVAFGLINFLSLRNRVRAAVAKNPALEANASNIIAGVLFFLTVPYLALGILQTLGGYDTALFFYYAPLTDPPVLLALAVPLVCVLVLSAWVWLRDGARKMVAYGLSNTGERQLKIMFALAPLLLVFAFLWGRTFLAGSPFAAQP